MPRVRISSYPKSLSFACSFLVRRGALEAYGAAPGLADRLSSTGPVSAAAVATAAVNVDVSMKAMSAPSTDKSYVSLDASSDAIDNEGLPLVYDKDLIEAYWKKERGALNQRWSYFVGKAVPFLTKLVTLFIAEGEIDARHVPGLSRTRWSRSTRALRCDRSRRSWRVRSGSSSRASPRSPWQRHRWRRRVLLAVTRRAPRPAPCGVLTRLSAAPRRFTSPR